MTSDISGRNELCITGLSPSGHCGSAAYCGGRYKCCASCGEDCNMRCGYLPEGIEVRDDKKGLHDSSHEPFKDKDTKEQ